MHGVVANKIEQGVNLLRKEKKDRALGSRGGGGAEKTLIY